MLRPSVVLSTVTAALGFAAAWPTRPPSLPMGRVRFALSDLPRRNGPALRFVFRTEAMLSCHSLDAELHVGPGSIELGPFRATPNPGPCPPTVEPAIGGRDISLDAGHYELTVTNDGARDAYAVDIAPDYITVKPLRAPAVSILSDMVSARVRRNSFAFSCGSVERTAAFCLDAVRALEQVKGISHIALMPRATLPFVQSNGHWYDHPTQLFHYDSESDYVRAQQAMRDYYRAHVGAQSGYSFRFSSWRAEDVVIAS